MDKIILIVHMLTALGIIGLILLQQGKGAEAGASFGGGASQTVFGSSGGGNFFTRATAILATVFFVTSFGLAIVAKQNAGVSVDEGIPTLQIEPESDVPAAASDEISDSDLPSLQDVADEAAATTEAAANDISDAANAVLDQAAESAEAAAQDLQENAAEAVEAAEQKVEENKPQ
ncbi:preprotein translocase subunit SecG [uncultured Pseudoteredinibacter sp.]|uniref:preprotein translocase subunit SecG n=1 Tax=uncultured Pseudoteredinibacter sp. TaxID=1641701 RepID=UPI0034440495